MKFWKKEKHHHRDKKQRTSLPKIIFYFKKFGNGHGYNNCGVHDAAVITSDFFKTFGYSCDVFPVENEEELISNAKEHHSAIKIIEGIWFDSEKIKEVPGRKIIRSHSQWSFIDEKTIKLMYEYQKNDEIEIVFNCFDSCDVFKNSLIESNNVFYIGNLFNFPAKVTKNFYDDNIFKIGMFGELRPMKNYVAQAMAVSAFATYLAKESDIVTELHVNSSLDSDPVLRNLREIAKNNKNLILVEHDWLHGKDYDDIICAMNLGLQVSFTETFNQTAAKFVINGTPVIGSYAIKWLPEEAKVNASEANSLYDKLIDFYSRVLFSKYLDKSFDNLCKLVVENEKAWLNFIEKR